MCMPLCLQLPGCEHLPVIGLIAHMDTTPDMTGKDVKPQILHYDGGDLMLNPEQNIVMRGSDFPELKKFIGQDLVCTDGTTLLGADDQGWYCHYPAGGGRIAG